MDTKAILGPMRLPFLVLPPVCVLLGTATAVWSGADINPIHLVLAFIGGLSAHISVNALNEYFDFKSGLDFKTKPTPFSGGSGTLPTSPELAHVALMTGLASLLATGIIGVYFLVVRGWGLLPLGLLGLAVVVIYTPGLTKEPLLCLVAPGLGFGTCMVMGTDFVLTGSYSATAFVSSLVPFFLVSDLLLLNQFPDIEADRSVGRRHLVIVKGTKTAVRVYGAFLACAYGAVILGCVLSLLPYQSLLALATIPIAVVTVRGVVRHADDIPNLIPYMARNVLLNILTPTLLSAGLFLAHARCGR